MDEWSENNYWGSSNSSSQISDDETKIHRRMTTIRRSKAVYLLLPLLAGITHIYNNYHHIYIVLRRNNWQYIVGIVLTVLLPNLILCIDCWLCIVVKTARNNIWLQYNIEPPSGLLLRVNPSDTSPLDIIFVRMMLRTGCNDPHSHNIGYDRW